MIIFDTETTNLTKSVSASLDKQPKIIEYYGLKANDETFEIEGELHCLIHPGEQISDEIEGITKITNSMLKGQPKFPAFYSGLCDFHLGQKVLVGHNISFDVDMLKFELQRIGREFKFPWPFKHVCTVELSEHYEGRRLKLIDLHERLTGEKFDNAHRAKADVMATYACVKEMRKLGDWPEL